MPAPLLHDLACVVHLHSTYSDGTGTVPEIAAAAADAGADVVLLTDHDTLEAKRRGEEGWYGSVLLLVGEEVSPRGRNHYLAFGLDEPIDHSGLDSAGIVRAVTEAGGFGFAAHPWSKGSERFRRVIAALPFHDIETAGLTGIEMWSFLTDGGESVGSVWDFVRFLVRPIDVLDHPPELNMETWDRLCAARRTVAIGGLDAHQIGVRVAGRVPVRLMAYRRSFRQMRTHVLCEEMPTGELEHDRDQVYDALREGRCYIAVDALAPARGFSFWAEAPDGRVLPMGAEAPAGDWVLRASVPRPAQLRLRRDSNEVASALGGEVAHPAGGEAGVYRVTATLEHRGRDRTWIVSNPIYLR